MKFYNKKRSVILFCKLLFAALFVCVGCDFTNHTASGKLTKDLQWEVTSEAQNSDLRWKQTIQLTKGRTRTLELETNSKTLHFYRDSFRVDGVNRPCIFIYNIYSGWGIVDAENLALYKDFTDIPTDIHVLEQLRDMDETEVIATYGK